MKTIELRRRELVWEERRCEYTEEDFNKWKEAYKKYLMYFEPVPQNVVDKLGELTFDIVCEYINYNHHDDGLVYYNQEKEDLFHSFYIKVLGRTFDLLDAAERDVREMNFDCDICDTSYADDYDEDWIVA